MRACVFACVYIGACTVGARSMWLLAEGSELLAWWVFFFPFLFSSQGTDSSSNLSSALLFSYEESRAVEVVHATSHPWPTNAGNSSSQMFWGCKIKKMFACQPPCIFKGFSFIGWQSRRVSCVSLVDFCQKKNGRWMPTFPQTSVPCQ